jgi:hypothetical protein
VGIDVRYVAQTGIALEISHKVACPYPSRAEKEQMMQTSCL